MIAREEWLQIPLEARLVEHDTLAQRILDLNTEITRLERLATAVTPY
jgi:hypothetical protein